LVFNSSELGHTAVKSGLATDAIIWHKEIVEG